MSEVSELIPPPAGGAGDGVDEVGSSGVSGAPGGAATPPQIRPILPTLPPRPSKTATAPSAPGTGADSAAAQASTAPPGAPVTESPAAAPTLLTAPPLVAPPLAAPPAGAPVLAAPTVPMMPAAPSAPGLVALPPPSTAPVVADLPPPVPLSGPASESLPVEGSAVPSLPTLGLAPAKPGLAAMRLNLEPIEDVAARAAANAEHEHQAEIAQRAQQAEPETPASSFTNGSALSMLSSAPGAAPDAAATTSAPTGSAGPVVPTLASNRAATTTDVDGDIDEAAIEQATEDALAAAAAKSGDPHLLAAAAHFAAQKQAAALPQVRVRKGSKQRTRRGRIIMLAFVLLAGSGTAYLFRDSAIMHKARGVGYDPQALPGTVYERPAPGTLKVSFSVTSVQQLPSGDDVSVRTFTDLTMNPTTGDGQYDGTQTLHPIVDGEAERDAVSTETSALVETATATYRRSSSGDNPGVWQTVAADPLADGLGNVVLMYQDVVDESLRRVRPVSTETTVDDANTLTTYTWAIPVGEFYESAPQLSGLAEMLDGSADPESTVTVVLTVDATGVVHLIDVALELDAVLSHTAEVRADGRDIPYHYRWELTSMSDEAFVAAVPEGASPIPDPSLDPAVVDPAAAEPVAGAPVADPAAADPAATVPAAVDPAAVPETVPATAPVAPVGG